MKVGFCSAMAANPNLRLTGPSSDLCTTRLPIEGLLEGRSAGL